jgi:hypothetical protein
MGLRAAVRPRTGDAEIDVAAAAPGHGTGGMGINGLSAPRSAMSAARSTAHDELGGLWPMRSLRESAAQSARRQRASPGARASCRGY